MIMIVNEYENHFHLQFFQIVVDCYWNTNKAKLAQRIGEFFIMVVDLKSTNCRIVTQVLCVYLFHSTDSHKALFPLLGESFPSNDYH